MSAHGLAPLISPYKIDEFIAEYWPKRPFVVHGLTHTVRPLTALPFLQSLEDLLKAWASPVQVHLPDVADESHSIDTSASEAPKYFKKKMALLFNNVQSISPELKTWLMALHSDLGLPTSTFSRCMVYATPSGKGTAAHFDQNINFVLQLQGTKKWWLAPNENFENPTQRFTISQPLDPELGIYGQGDLPSAMPQRGQQEIVLKPGSMLFVPRGYWHTTEAEGEALALNFTFSQPTWVDLFTAALRSRLLLSPEWRELADGVTSANASQRQIAEEKFDLLLAELVHDLPNWRAADILAATEGQI